MKKIQVEFRCQNCGYTTAKWLGKCPQCEAYNTFSEEVSEPVKRYQIRPHTKAKPVLLSEISVTREDSIKTGIIEFDRVIGGGIVRGSVNLLGGDPGIGKSTLTLQIASTLSKQGRNVLYISAEESGPQLKIRASRLGLSNEPGVYILCEMQLDPILSCMNELKPDLVIIDSIQMLYKSEIPLSPGSVTQVRECAAHLTHAAKESNTAVIMIGHITKEGAIAGPKSLEHLVDAVFYLEGDRYQSFRILRSIKNRFGSTSEIGVFEMTQTGLSEVINPSEIFISGQRDGRTGSVVTASLVGSRVLLSELQALTSPCHAGFPSRRVTGLDYQRIHQLIAVLDSRCNISLSNYDVFINVVGGVRIDETSADLPAILAIASSLKKKPIDSSTCAVGEVGLSGEVRPTGSINQRVGEAVKLGFKRIILPKGNSKEITAGTGGAKLLQVSQVSDAISLSGL